MSAWLKCGAAAAVASQRGVLRAASLARGQQQQQGRRLWQSASLWAGPAQALADGAARGLGPRRERQPQQRQQEQERAAGAMPEWRAYERLAAAQAPRASLGRGLGPAFARSLSSSSSGAPGGAPGSAPGSAAGGAPSSAPGSAPGGAPGGVAAPKEGEPKEGETVKVGKLRAMFTAYGPVAVGVYGGVYVTTLTGLFMLVHYDHIAARDVIVALSNLGLNEYVDMSLLDNKMGDFALAWILTKFTEPLRALATVAVTPRVAGWLGRKPETTIPMP